MATSPLCNAQVPQGGDEVHRTTPPDLVEVVPLTIEALPPQGDLEVHEVVLSVKKITLKITVRIEAP